MDDAHTVIPLSPMRKVIAVRMAEANRTIPHFRLAADLELDALMKLRQELQSLRPQEKLSLNDLLIKCCAMALMDSPAVNILWGETELFQYHTTDISVLMALGAGGLVTPIVRAAHTKSVWQISREVKDLAARAAKNALKMTEIVGGSFSISNLGMYGVDRFDAIINPPQCAILALGAAKPRVLASPDRQMRIATVLQATLSADHRAIDGATGAAFLSALRSRVEQPEHLRSSAIDIA
jgi:pyruvate dehydrogenase E2 component (dihydrolipoamide acetyltransferase)